MPPKSKPSHYDYNLLELARGYFESSGVYILNPRNTDERSLFLADADWMSDFNSHMAWVHHKKALKRPKS